jgi:hypothetical protein
MSCAHDPPFPAGTAMQDQASGDDLITAADTTGIHARTAAGVLSRARTPTQFCPCVAPPRTHIQDAHLTSRKGTARAVEGKYR